MKRVQSVESFCFMEVLDPCPSILRNRGRKRMLELVGISS